MRTGGLARRLSDLERVATPEDAPGAFAIVDPDSWEPAVLAAYDDASARGDREAQAGIIERETGRRLPPSMRIVQLRSRPDGPQ